MTKRQRKTSVSICTHCSSMGCSDSCWRGKKPTKSNTCVSYRRMMADFDKYQIDIYTEREGSGVIELVEECPDCHREVGHTECIKCKGSGVVPSKTGQKIIDLVKTFG